MDTQQEETYCTIDKCRTQFESFDTLSALHINTRSITNKLDDIGVLLQETNGKFELLLFTETLLSDCEPPPIFQGYVSHSLGLQGRKGGGVAIYIKECAKHSGVDEFSIIEDDLECLTLKIANFTVSVLYRPPSGDQNKTCEYIERLLQYGCHQNEPFLLMGDISADLAVEGFFTSELLPTAVVN